MMLVMRILLWKELLIAITEPNEAKGNKSVTFENNAPFINCISKINGVQIGNVEDLYVVMQFAWIQQKLQKKPRKFVELLQRWTK